MEGKADFLDFDKNSGVPGKKKLNNLLLLQKDDEQQVERKLKTEELVQTKAPEKSKPRIDRITPSPLMERLAAFIPQIRQANEELQSREPRSYCIDLVGADDDPNGGSKEVPSPPSDQTDTEMPMIEMSLGLGVYEGKHEGTEEEEEGLREIRLPGQDRKRKVVLEGGTSSSEDDPTAS